MRSRLLLATDISVSAQLICSQCSDSTQIVCVSCNELNFRDFSSTELAGTGFSWGGREFLLMTR